MASGFTGASFSLRLFIQADTFVNAWYVLRFSYFAVPALPVSKESSAYLIH